jgi:hypothetical protein
MPRLVSEGEMSAGDDAVSGVIGEAIVKLPLGAGIAITAVISAAGSALAVDLPHRAGAQNRLSSIEIARRATLSHPLIF